MKKVMVIVWKWDDLQDQGKIQDRVLVEKNYDSLVIRINEHKSKVAIKRFLDLIKLHPESSFQFFLHRGRDHFYNSEDVKVLRSKILALGISSERIKVFLFGSGADFIYYENNENGLLDTVGGFMEEIDYEFKNNTIGEVKILNQEGKIKPQYFSKTWRYYQHEFSTKIQQFYMDFMDHSVDLKNSSNNQKQHNAKYWINKIKEKEHLWLQLKSFLGYYDSTVLSLLDRNEQVKREREFKKLQRLEITHWRSYSFDDCIANFTWQPDIQRAYYELTNKLGAVFIEGKRPLSLVEIKQDFEYFMHKTLNNE